MNISFRFMLCSWMGNFPKSTCCMYTFMHVDVCLYRFKTQEWRRFNYRFMTQENWRRVNHS
jgi:hypothetical protein